MAVLTRLANIEHPKPNDMVTSEMVETSLTYCEIILIRGVFNYVEFVGKTIHELQYPRYKIPSVILSNLLVNNINMWYEPCILQVRNVI